MPLARVQFILVAWQWDVDCIATRKVFPDTVGDPREFRSCTEYHYVEEGIYNSLYVPKPGVQCKGVMWSFLFLFHIPGK